MVEVGEASLGPSPSPPPPPSPEPEGEFVGNLVVEVKCASVCWDTTPDGQPGPCSGAEVVVDTHGDEHTQTTDDEGRATFENIHAGIANVTVTKNEYRHEGSPPVAIVSEGETETLTVELVLSASSGRSVCQRQHTAVPGPSGNPGNPPLPMIFWHGHYMIWLREAAWLLLLICMLTFLAIAAVDMADNGKIDLPLGGFCLPAALFAAVAYLNHIIFGQEVGITSMVLAALAWIALIVLTVLAATGDVLGLPIHLVWFPSLCGMWGCFFVWLAIRFDTWKVEQQWFYIFFYALVAIVFAVPIYFIVVVLTNPVLWAKTDEVVGWMFAVILVSWVCGLVSSVAGHVMRNDASLSSDFVRQGEPKKLPFAGFAFCVQGNRGWFSHFGHEELCYDFAVPLGSHVLAIEEGHVVSWEDSNLRSLYDALPPPPATGPAPPALNSPNKIYVEHRDGSVSRYLHLVHHGVRDVNNLLNTTSDGLGPIHVHAGQVLAKAGSTGMSRFSHIHLGLYSSATSSVDKGLAFSDASVQRHGGRCYTFRPYTSDNIHRGPMSL